MANTWFKAIEVTGANVIKIGENYPPYKPVYLPYCPKDGKEEECKRQLEEILAGEDGVSVLVLNAFTTNSMIYDVRCRSTKQFISDIMAERGLAIKWNWPGS